MEHRATYSPEDNKLRIYPAQRLDEDDYAKLKAAGYKWAPKQQIFVAPMWSPEREDAAIDLCGPIEDEDTSLVDRAEDRAERFETYRDKRLSDAEAAKRAADSIAGNIPLGQPILVGHHSERHARRDAEKIERSMRKAVNMWETSKYWERRAAGALAHAKYKEKPDVRARRIKKIEADKRKAERTRDEAKSFLNLWLFPVPLTRIRALAITGRSYYSQRFPLDKYPRPEGATQYEGEISLYTALDDRIITPKHARNIHAPALERTIAGSLRWIAHYENRLIYERAMLNEQGAAHLAEKKPRPTQLPLLNYRAPEGVMLPKMYSRGEHKLYNQIEMTKAEYSAIHNDHKGTRICENSHRVRIAIRFGEGKMSRFCVFLTDSKTHKKPEPIKPEPKAIPMVRTAPKQNTEKTVFDNMRETLKAGVQAVTSPTLFETPKDLAERMVFEAGIKPGHIVLEPSAGTGVIAEAIKRKTEGVHLYCIEINHGLCEILRGKGIDAIQHDFLEAKSPICPDSENGFDRILMNPPFNNGDDIKHIRHAMTFLKPGGKIVAISANGPRQQKHLKTLAEWSGGFYEPLPAGTFSAAGTNVSSALVVINS